MEGRAWLLQRCTAPAVPPHRTCAGELRWGRAHGRQQWDPRGPNPYSPPSPVLMRSAQYNPHPRPLAAAQATGAPPPGAWEPIWPQLVSARISKQSNNQHPPLLDPQPPTVQRAAQPAPRGRWQQRRRWARLRQDPADLRATTVTITRTPLDTS